MHEISVMSLNINFFCSSSAHCAASQGALKCLELLNTYDADLEAKNDQTDTPLHEAASAGQEGKADEIYYWFMNEIIIILTLH